jgi:hypothetical protein
VAEQRIKDQVQGFPSLERLAIGQNHLMDPGVSSGQRIGQVPRVQRGHGGIAHNDGRGRWGRFGEGGRITQQSGADGNGVTAVAERDRDPLDGGNWLHSIEFRSSKPRL